MPCIGLIVDRSCHVDSTLQDSNQKKERKITDCDVSLGFYLPFEVTVPYEASGKKANEIPTVLFWEMMINNESDDDDDDVDVAPAA
ncbi:hypothetical protein ZOSMA_330G00220 [Zostera marina]|uniref:Uncharacterized protein n=1 Tax=Zostera marina TaxID=29655 RepID=A0A0K9P876_ZOSMR|nr:hypothetical protein ZOSMA_330G00220 [Zostera marina]